MFPTLAVYAPVSLVGWFDLGEGLGVAHYGALLAGPLDVQGVANLQGEAVVLLVMAGCLEFISSCRFSSIETQ